MADDPTSDLFKDELKELEIDPTKDYLPELVGEGKKFKTAQDLAKSVLFKDSHISRIERENAELRAEVQKRLNMEEFLSKVDDSQRKIITTRDSTMPTSGSEQPLEGDHHEQAKPLSKEELLKAVRDVILEETTVKQASENLRLVKQHLQETLGQDYVQHIKTKAKELSVPEVWLNDMAAKTPQAFMKLMDLDQIKTEKKSQESLFNPSRSTLNQGLGKGPNLSGHKTKKEWAEIKQSDPKAYFANYSKMMKDALTLGEDFFN